MRSQPKIIVVGGSLVGPSGEGFLRTAGFTDVTTLEANPHPFSQSGGVMGVRYPTLDMLAELGITREQVIALTDSDVYAYDLINGEFVKRGVSNFPGYVTSWDALHELLADRTNVHRGHHVTGEFSADGRKHLICSCGQDHEADYVLYADGRKSTGRTLVDPDRPLSYNGYIVWRGLVTPPADPPHGFHRYYDIEGGRLFSLTEPVVQTGKSYFEFSHNLDEGVYTQLTGKRPTDMAYMLPGWVKRHRDQVLDVIRFHAVGIPHRFEELIEAAEISGIPVNDVPFPSGLLHRGDHGGTSVLFGDAAVPVRLQVGAGLNQGLWQMHSFVQALTRGMSALHKWETATLNDLALWVEQGRSRAHRNNLGWYLPVKRGSTTAPRADQWAAPHWVTA